MMPDRQFERREHRAARPVADDEKRRAEERGRRQYQPMVGADHEPDQVRHDDADKPDRSADRDGRAGREGGAEERDRVGAVARRAARAGGVRAKAQQIERAREPRERGEGQEQKRQRGQDRRVAGDVEVAHQPAQRAIGLAKSLRYCTNRISAEKNAFSVTPESSSTVVESPRWCARERIDDRTAMRAPARLAAATPRRRGARRRT